MIWILIVSGIVVLSIAISLYGIVKGWKFYVEDTYEWKVLDKDE